MSCRGTPAGSLGTTFIQYYYGLTDPQSTALFHHLTNEQQEHNLPANESAYRQEVDAIEALINQDPSIPEWRRTRLLTRIQGAHNSAAPAPGPRYALTRLRERALRARQAQDHLITDSASRYSMTQDEVRAEFERLRASVPPRTRFRASSVTAHRGVLMVLEDFAPDAGTQFAAVTLLLGERCPICGQFTGHWAEHTCPSTVAATEPPQAAPEARPTPVRARRTRQRVTATPAAENPAESLETPQGEGVLPMPAFQALYNAVRARVTPGERVRQLPIPSITGPDGTYGSLQPGEVTGGLGHPETGNSFGIELELDFPDDEYPYRRRQQFARRLYDEGICASPRVERWHHVGEAGRPGGEYTVDSARWSCEFDRSVDSVDGERGVEIKSQILYDTPETWKNLARICAVAEELGGRATARTGLHVNVGGRQFEATNPAKHTALLRLGAAYDDTLIRIANNPRAGVNHRGRGYCQYVEVPPEGFRGVREAQEVAWHRSAINLHHLPVAEAYRTNASRIEHRIWDSTTDVGRIQAAVGVSLALVEHATRLTEPGQGPEHSGTHSRQYGERRLTGDAWAASTESFRRFMGLMADAGLRSERHRDALVTMFAVSKWPQP